MGAAEYIPLVANVLKLESAAGLACIGAHAALAWAAGDEPFAPYTAVAFTFYVCAPLACTLLAQKHLVPGVMVLVVWACWHSVWQIPELWAWIAAHRGWASFPLVAAHVSIVYITLCSAAAVVVLAVLHTCQTIAAEVRRHADFMRPMHIPSLVPFDHLPRANRAPAA